MRPSKHKKINCRVFHEFFDNKFLNTFTVMIALNINTKHHLIVSFRYRRQKMIKVLYNKVFKKSYLLTLMLFTSLLFKAC